jgi:hypothetical protein
METVMSGDTPTGEQPKKNVKFPEPPRSWSIHCIDGWGDPGVCVIEIEKGAIVIYAPESSTAFTLGAKGAAEFHTAFAEAVEVVETGPRARATSTTDC